MTYLKRYVCHFLFSGGYIKMDYNEYLEYLELAQSTKVHHRELAASLRDCPIEILEQLSVDKEISVLKELAKNPNSTTKILKKIITPQTKTKMYEMGSEIIQHKNCTVDILYKSLKFDFLYGYILLNPICTDDIKEQIVDFIINNFNKVIEDNYIRNSYLLYALKNVSLPKNLFEKLSKIKNVTLLEALAENTNFPSEFMRNLTVKIGNETGYAINHLMMVAKNPNTPQELIRELYNSYQINLVINNIALNPNCPKDIMYDLAKVSYSDPEETVQLKCNLASNPSCPLDILEKLAIHKDQEVRVNVSYNSNITLDLLIKLINDEDEVVRINSLWNPICPEEIIVKLYRTDKDDWVRECAEEVIDERGIDIFKYPMEETTKKEETKSEITSDFIVELKDNIEETTDFIAELHCIEFNDSENETLRIYTKPNSSLGRIKLIELTKNENEDNTTYKYILNIEKDETDLRYRTIIKVKDDLVKALNQTIIMIEETPLRCYIDDIQYIIEYVI